MKLRLRSLETKETFKIDVPTPCSLENLKTLIAARLDVPPSSLRLSLNRRDELPPSPLPSLGLSSGDLLFFTNDPLVFSRIPTPPASSPPPDQVLTETLPAAQEEKPEASSPMVIDEASAAKISSFSIPGFLKRGIEAEAGCTRGDIGLLVIAVHAVFLESGFVVHDDSSGFRLPQGWAASPSPVVSIAYTVAAAAEPVKVKVSFVGRFANVYGSMCGSADVYRVCLDAGRFVPAITSCVGEIGKRDDVELFEMWKLVKDGLSLPLLMDICEKNGLPSPPCFARLPTELKIRVLDFLPGVDLARIGCVSSELRYLSSSDDLWAKKIIEEFGYMDGKGLFGERWKDQFVICWKKKKSQRGFAERHRAYNAPRMPPFWDRRVPFPPPRFNMIGGDYDRFPIIGGFGNGRAGQAFPRTLARQSFSPNCNLGSFNR